MGRHPTHQPDHLKPGVASTRPSGLWAAQSATPVLRLYLGLAFFLLLLMAALVGLVAWVGDSGVLGSMVLLLLINMALLLHLLGHLLAAWLCRVQVRLVALGLGPTLPRCRFRRGMTEFRVNVVPLGGYVRLAERGADVGRGEDYPRVLRNRPWWQRVLVRWAGVALNALVAVVCFIAGLAGRESPRTPGVIGRVESGSPLWQEGVHSGWAIRRLGDRTQPSFEEIHALTVVTPRGQTLSGEFQSQRGTGRELRLTLSPLRGDGRFHPSLGFHPPERLEVVRPVRSQDSVVNPLAAAAAARVLDFSPGVLVIGCSDPDAGGAVTTLAHDLERRWWDTAAFDQRLRRLRNQPVRVRYLQQRGWRRRWVARERELKPEGFQPGDRIIACSRVPDSGQTYDPFDQQPLPANPRAGSEGGDPVVFRNRLLSLIDHPITVTVQRGDDSGTAILYIPRAHHRVLPGGRMAMGKIKAVRRHSSAAYHGIQPGDQIIGIALRDARGEELCSRQGTALDPERLPIDLLRAARSQQGEKTVTLDLRRSDGSRRECDLVWEDDWESHHEGPIAPAAPQSIPALGLAYHVEARVTHVAAGSTAEGAGLRPGDVVRAVRLSQTHPVTRQLHWGDWFATSSSDDGTIPAEGWAFVGETFQHSVSPRVQLLLRRDGSDLAEPIELDLIDDPDWPRSDRGLYLGRDLDRGHIAGWSEALRVGMINTADWDRQMVTRSRALPSLANLLSMCVLTSPLNDTDFLALLAFLFGALNVNVVALNLLPLPFCESGVALAGLARRWRCRRRQRSPLSEQQLAQVGS